MAIRTTMFKSATGAEIGAISWDNPTYATADGSVINVDLYDPLLGWSPKPFSLRQVDASVPFDVAQLWAAIVADGQIAPYVAP